MICWSFEDAASSGQLQVAFENLGTNEMHTLRTRWSASGQGRADVVFTGSGGGSITASECWAGRSQDFAEVYDTKHLEWPQLSDPSGCAPPACNGCTIAMILPVDGRSR